MGVQDITDERTDRRTGFQRKDIFLMIYYINNIENNIRVMS